MVLPLIKGYPGDITGKEPTCQGRKYKRCGFDPWVGNIPYRMHGKLGDLPTQGLSPGLIHWRQRFSFFTAESSGNAYIYIYIYRYSLMCIGLPCVLNWPKSSFRLFHKMLYKNRNELFGYPNNIREETATQSSVPPWRIPRTEEPGGIQPVGSQRVGHSGVTNTSVFSIGFLRGLPF